MAVAVVSAQRKLIKLFGRAAGFLLGFFGVLTSSCGIDPVAYGPPSGLFITGLVKDSGTPVEDIEISVMTADSSMLFQTDTNADGAYWADLTAWPDTVLVTAKDVDGPSNGSYLPDHEYIAGIPEEGSLYYTVDFDLEPDTKD